jgi:membrane associated rhomboid family serine protease
MASVQPRVLSRMNLRRGRGVFDLVAHLLSTRSGARALHIVQLTEDYATLTDRRWFTVRIVRHPGSSELVETLVDECVSHNQAPGGELFIVGGETTAGIEAGLPRLLIHPFRVVHLGANKPPQVLPAGKSNDEELAGFSQMRQLSEEEMIALLSTAGHHADSRREEGKVRADFFSRMRGERPRATIALLGVIFLVFLLQELWGPKEAGSYFQNEFMLRMGALYSPLVEQGEWWRMISAGFLHGGLMHVGANSFVLYLLGGQLERVLGLKRFLIIYTAAVLGGSFLSLQLLGNGLSVGASGAIWGLLGAQICLAYGRPPVLPKSIAEAMRPAAKQNLILNVGISFMANIDWAAHLGGGLAGAAVLISGVLYREASGREGESKSQEPTWLTLAAGACVVLLLYGVLSALFAGQPWRFENTPTS